MTSSLSVCGHSRSRMIRGVRSGCRRFPEYGGVLHRPAQEVPAQGQQKEITISDAISFAMGDHNPQAGAWIRFNPFDGQGVKNANVTDFRFALVESDSMEPGMQEARSGAGASGGCFGVFRLESLSMPSSISMQNPWTNTRNVYKIFIRYAKRTA